MSDLKIFHNPRCSKSRQTLQLLKDKGLEPVVVEYLKTPPAESELQDIVSMLELASARDLIRNKEPEFKALGLQSTSLSEAQLIKAMAETPKLIERPIVIFGNKARIGRPPEDVLDII